MMSIKIKTLLITTLLLTTTPAIAKTSSPNSRQAVSPVLTSKCNSNACHARVAKKLKIQKRKSCRSVSCKRRVAAKQQIRRKQLIVVPFRGWLARTRSCESGGNYNISTGNGFYGAYQFMVGTWHSIGGRGYPHNASRLEQDYRAVLLLKRSGRGQWPVCG